MLRDVLRVGRAHALDRLPQLLEADLGRVVLPDSGQLLDLYGKRAVRARLAVGQAAAADGADVVTEQVQELGPQP